MLAQPRLRLGFSKPRPSRPQGTVRLTRTFLMMYCLIGIALLSLAHQSLLVLGNRPTKTKLARSKASASLKRLFMVAGAACRVIRKPGRVRGASANYAAPM